MTETPQGPTQRRWYAAGYQAALADIARAFDQGGEAEALEWLANNLQGDAR